MAPPTPEAGSVTTIYQRFYDNPSIPPITLEHVDLASLTSKSVADLVATLSGAKLGVAASYGKKCVLEALAFSTESRVLLITMDGTSRSAKRGKSILKDGLLCNVSLEKHGFIMERLAAALHLDLGLHVRRAFDVTSSGDTRGSRAAYKSVLARARTEDSLNEPAVKSIFKGQPSILSKDVESRKTRSRRIKFVLRAWACYVGVQGDPNQPGAIDTSVMGPQVRSICLSCIASPDRSD